MNVVITGAAGFLGRWFLEWHHLAGDQVFACDDFSSPYADDTGYSIVRKDAAKYLKSLKGHYERAYHFAAPVGGRTKIEGDPMFNADALRLDSVFFRWAIDHVDTAVYPSSSAVYGTLLQTEEMDRQLTEGMFNPENTTWFAPDELYGFTKMAGEMLAFKSSAYGLNTLCIRPFSGYGEGQSLEYPIPSICQRAFKREDPLVVWGSGKQKRDLVHVSDLVGATIARLEAGVSGYESMNIGTGWGSTFATVASLAASIVGYEPTIVTDETKPQGVMNRRADTGRMSFFYEPTVSLKDGLARVLEDIGAKDRPS